MVRKLFAHAKCRLDNGRWVCVSCGTELTGDSIYSERPCSVPTAWYVELDEAPGLLWFIDVWNMQGAIRAMEQKDNMDIVRLVSVDEDEAVLDRAIEECVYKQGGALNISGHYGLTDEMAQRVRDWLNSGRIKIE